MGNWYTNVTLRGPSPDAVLAFLRDEKIPAYVTSASGSQTVIYDRASENDHRDPEILAALAQRLSKTFACPAFAVSVFHDDALWFRLYECGERRAEYFNGNGTMFGTGRLCAAFGAMTNLPIVWLLMRVPHFALLFEHWRHALLVRTLRLPLCAVGLGYNYIADGEADYVHRGIQFTRT
jgi:hypothetical protein